MVLGKTNLRIHVAAPTNVAVCELARRYLSRSGAGAMGLEKEVRLRDMVLVGTAKRLGIADEEDQLDDVHFEHRIDRLKLAAGHFHNDLSSFLHMVNNSTRKLSDAKSNSKNDEILAYIKNFKDTLMTLRKYVRTLYQEAPAGMVKGLLKSDVVEFRILSGMLLSKSDSDLELWLISFDQRSPSKEALSTVISALRNTRVRMPKDLKLSILREATTVFSTVNVGGRELFDLVAFDVVVIDEW